VTFVAVSIDRLTLTGFASARSGQPVGCVPMVANECVCVLLRRFSRFQLVREPFPQQSRNSQSTWVCNLKPA
jgi:hypothetical protein